MKIVIIGDGKVGHKLTTQLSEEDYDITLIDQNAGKLKAALNNLDIFCINGNGADAEVLKQADVPHADIVIACTSTDEMNMISCLLAKRLGAKHTIARVRNPLYYRQMELLKEDLHLSMAVNPEPVSYTHLDVYKRQRLYSGSAKRKMNRQFSIRQSMEIQFRKSADRQWKKENLSNTKHRLERKNGSIQHRITQSVRCHFG